MLAARLVLLAELTANAFTLFFVAMQSVPLVLASLNGLEVIGAELHLPTHRKLALTLASKWADQAVASRTITFLVGEYQKGARLFAAPLDFNPQRNQIVRSVTQRRRLHARGYSLAWCTLAALTGTIVYDAAARAVAACESLRCPVPHLADAVAFGHPALTSFSIGVFASRPMLDRVELSVQSTTPKLALARVGAHAVALLARLRAAEDVESHYWADVIKPEELQDVPPGLFDRLPTFEDKLLDQLPFSPPFSPRLHS